MNQDTANAAVFYVIATLAAAAVVHIAAAILGWLP